MTIGSGARDFPGRSGAPRSSTSYYRQHMWIALAIESNNNSNNKDENVVDVGDSRTGQLGLG